MRTCMFCHELADTGEDAWPQWLIKRFPSSDVARTYLERVERAVNSWHTRKPKLVVKRVCSGCNNGWMSRLEDEAKPVMESILDGHLTSLDPSAQLTLAKWAVKTAMVLEALDSSRPWFYSENERWLMREAQKIPVRTWAWIAKCIHHPHIYSVKKDLSTVRCDDGPRAIATTMAFGFLAFQVVSIRTLPETPTHDPVSYEVSNGPWEQTLVQIWPISDRLLTWPPDYGLDGDWGLDTLTERLSAAKWQSTDVASAE